jgi:hypothetical protein
MTDYNEWGPLGNLVGIWEGDDGLDVAFQHANGRVGETPYRERTEMKPFGPVDNGKQSLYGLDYRMAAWRAGEENPFHTEVGYWLWDAPDRAVTRCFMIPRGSTVLAGGVTTPDASTFTMSADVGSETYGILSNPYLARAARTIRYVCTITVGGPDEWSYDETSTIDHERHGDVLEHTDRNRLHRVG